MYLVKFYSPMYTIIMCVSFEVARCLSVVRSRLSQSQSAPHLAPQSSLAVGTGSCSGSGSLSAAAASPSSSWSSSSSLSSSSEDDFFFFLLVLVFLTFAGAFAA